MSGTTMVVTIVFLAIAGTVLIMQQVKGMRRPLPDNEENRKLRAQITDLEERVRTLERIATDKKSNLKDRIDSL